MPPKKQRTSCTHEGVKNAMTHVLWHHFEDGEEENIHLGVSEKNSSIISQLLDVFINVNSLNEQQNNFLSPLTVELVS